MNASSNSSSLRCHLPFSSAVAMVVINAIFSIIGILGNLLVCLAVYKDARLRTLANAYLVVLAILDFLTCAVVQPLLIAMIVQEAKQKCEKTLETIFRTFGNFLVAASFLVLCSITTERCLAVFKPITSVTVHPQKRFYILTSLSMVISLTYTIVRMAVSETVTSYVSGIILVLGILYITLCYFCIVLKLRRQNSEMTSLISQENNTSRRRAEKAVTVTMAIVIGIFTVMWIPFFYFRISQPSTHTGMGYNWVRTTAISNSALNPIVYALRMKQFRLALKLTKATISNPNTKPNQHGNPKLNQIKSNPKL